MEKNTIKNKKYSYTKNREISWLQFNERVLEEAKNPQVPLLEQLNFINIFTTNLDEFYSVRVGTLHDLNITQPTYKDNKTGWTPEEQLKRIYEETRELYKQKDIIYHNTTLELKQKDIINLRIKDLTKKELEFLHNYFQKFIKPLLKPYIIDEKHPFPQLNNLTLNIFINIENQTETQNAIIIIPKTIPKLIYLYKEDNNIKLSPIDNLKKPYFIQTEKIILKFIDEIFPDYTINQKALIKITRKDINIKSVTVPPNEDYLEYIEKQVKMRPNLTPIRLEIYRNKNPKIKRLLSQYLKLDYNQIFILNSPLDTSFIEELNQKIDKEKFEKLIYKPYTPQLTNQLNNENIIKQIQEKDALIFYPYESIETFLKLLYEAANDPEVTSIKIALYRISKHSKIIEILIQALKNGKYVTVLIELRARYDEENNIHYTKILKENGCKIIYGFEKYKVHCKLCLITKKSYLGVTYTAQIGTGNYNEDTSKVYSDLCYLTSNDLICKDIIEYFKNMEEKNLKGEYNRLLVAPYDFSNKIIENIENTIKLAHNGEKAIIIMKMNGLTDINIINALVRASNEGVKIKLIIRGICTLIPGVKGYSENISVISIVGRFLEHARIYCFGREIEAYSNLPPESVLNMYISSADLMTRNTTERVEIAVPILDSEIKRVIYNIIDVMLHDNVNACKLNNQGLYEKMDNELMENNSQEIFMEIAIKNNHIEEISLLNRIIHYIKNFIKKVFKN